MQPFLALYEKSMSSESGYENWRTASGDLDISLFTLSKAVAVSSEAKSSLKAVLEMGDVVISEVSLLNGKIDYMVLEMSSLLPLVKRLSNLGKVKSDMMTSEVRELFQNAKLLRSKSDAVYTSGEKYLDDVLKYINSSADSSLNGKKIIDSFLDVYTIFDRALFDLKSFVEKLSELTSLIVKEGGAIDLVISFQDIDRHSCPWRRRAAAKIEQIGKSSLLRPKLVEVTNQLNYRTQASWYQKSLLLN
jgi:hypothetical protein